MSSNVDNNITVMSIRRFIFKLKKQTIIIIIILKKQVLFIFLNLWIKPSIEMCLIENKC